MNAQPNKAEPALFALAASLETATRRRHHYDCPQLLPDDVPRRFCSESGEWYRYVATDGTLLDKGFGLGAGLGNSDPRERGLRIRIGLPPDEEHVTFLPLIWPLPFPAKGP